MPNPSRNDIYEAAIRRMVAEALEAQEQQFALAHEKDTDEELAAYLQTCARKLNHTPWPREILGGLTIQKHFGSWEAALAAARLPFPDTPDMISRFARIQEETERQKLRYREKKALKKQRAQERMKAQAEKRKKNAQPLGDRINIP